MKSVLLFLMIFDDTSHFYFVIRFELIKTINRAGLTIVLVEQNVMQSLIIANRAFVLENGAITMSGKADELLESSDLKKSYLGI